MSLKKGTASNAMADFTSGNTLFRTGVESVFPGAKSGNTRVRLLPGFNEQLSKADPAKPLSWIPYRQNGVINQTTGRDELAEFYIQLRVYRFWGRQQATFFSPSCLDLAVDSLPEDRHDPMLLCREVARKDARWKHLADKPTGPDVEKFDKAVLPNYSTQAYMNCIAWEQAPTGQIMADSVRNAIVGLSNMGFELLIKQLDWLMTAGVPKEQTDPNWPNYLLGDVMSPSWGRIGWFAQQATEGNKNQQIWTIKLTSQEQRLVGSQLMPLAPEFAAKFLAGRYDIGDTEKVLHIMKPQEIVELMLADGDVPRDLIAYACGHIANIPNVSGTTFAAASTVHPGMNPATSAAPANPFAGAPAPAVADPFGGAVGGPPAMPAAAPANPFGGAVGGPPAMPAAAPASPFGGAPAAAFGSNAPVAASPFGGAPDMPFGAQAPLPGAANPFGGAAPMTQAAPPMMQSAPPMVQAPPMMQAAPPMVQQAPEPQEWFIWEGDAATGKANPATRSQVLAAAAVNPKVMVCSTAAGSSWKIPLEYGLVEAPAQAAPAVAFTAPIAAAPTASAGLALSPEERAELAQLEARSASEQLPIETFKRLLDLSKRAPIA